MNPLLVNELAADRQASLRDAARQQARRRQAVSHTSASTSLVSLIGRVASRRSRAVNVASPEPCTEG